MKIPNGYVVLLAVVMWSSCNMVTSTDKGGATDTPNALAICVFPDSIAGKAEPGGVVKIATESYNAFDEEGYFDSTTIREDSTFTFGSIPKGTYFLYLLYRERGRGVRVADIKTGDDRDSIAVAVLDTLGCVSGGVYQFVSENNRVGVDGISVCLNGSDIIGITGKEGDYVIPEVPVGIYTAVLRSIKTSGDLSKASRQVDLTTSNKAIMVDFTLK